jgi:hypothetical protein
MPHGALDLGVPQEELDGPQVLGLVIDQRGLGSAQGVGPIGLRVPTEEAAPTPDDGS